MLEKEFMHAVGFFEGLPINEERSFIDEKKIVPNLESRDVLVKVKAVSVNPIDTKLRKNSIKRNALRVLGFDAVGEVVDTGKEVEKFKIGDRVFYAGTTTRAGSNQEYQAVDERIVALAPKKLSDEGAAALPLTSLTAYELLFEKFGLIPEEGANKGKKILVINGAGGVGSVLNQLAHWAGLEIYATASPENFEWLEKLGVDHPIDYHDDLKDELGVQKVDYIAVLFDITHYLGQIKHMINPFGHVGTIVGIHDALDISDWKNLSVSFDWEYMFAKTDYNYQIETQGQALKVIARLADEGQLTTTLSKVYSDGINAVNLKKATKDVETGHMLGKVVISGPFNASK
ncbi:zinc-binding alcohol dehydrogenase family protein [Pediococcus pentosaceus]|jgi:NADPH2:quinone reductase|uniref:zinc-binding alcohol dehydrogenase family protein n=1 Tax=Pediococcus pentosaceus TaxID=1255 RepID=UPI000E02A4F8|nr:zinc-binding alcohol dehydrogenase family protein [Pediococcus pentosaceus]AXR43471.1 NADPH:quinone reductase [Pediococcus pentosaceus]KAF0519960.1 zinc-binding alcohol dehydrogenase family protein [Pediococcus pentosaceus]MBF7110803.1 zinc-binding alcohol dehydrogenase family protein [Pediococcus pentosaceus]MBF7116093.1 zinc-binding alcohol dehydrogenase family protein [Pediococcus pentosaceus]MBF7117776.1 zinc-binding alcohol dehydrogenase family protein [Pediococcus pentosaceus]